MKNLRSIIIGIIIGALATYFFCPRQAPDEHAVTTGEEKEDIKIPSGVISVKEAKDLDDNWTKERMQAVDAAAQKYGRDKDNRWTWWSVEDIENYIAYAREFSEKEGYKMTGLRVYLGVYGEKASASKKNLSTMFIVPTGHKNGSKASTFNISLPPSDDDIPGPPLNNGGGGGENYPQ